MTSPRLLKVAALVLAVQGIGLTNSFAENAPVGPPPGYPNAAANKSALVPDDAGPRMDFRFDGLPLTETIKSIQEQYHKAATPKYLNVVIGEHLRELAETNLVTLDVKQVTVDELLKLMGGASQRGISWKPVPYAQTGQPGKAGFSFIAVTASGGNPTYLLQSEYPAGYRPESPAPMNIQPAPPATPPAEPKRVSYFSLEPLLDRYKVEDITTAMKLGWELGGSKDLPTMKFHEETKLLVVSANEEQMQVINQVIQNLTSIVKARPQDGRLLKVALPGQGNPVPVPQSAIPVSPAKP